MAAWEKVMHYQHLIKNLPLKAALPSPILRCLASTSHRDAAPRSALLWAAPAGGCSALGRCGQGSVKRPL